MKVAAILLSAACSFWIFPLMTPAQAVASLLLLGGALIVFGTTMQVVDHLRQARPPAAAAPPPPPREVIVPAGMTYEIRCTVCRALVFRRPVPHGGHDNLGPILAAMGSEALHEHWETKPACVTFRETPPVFVPPRPC